MEHIGGYGLESSEKRPQKSQEKSPRGEIIVTERPEGIEEHGKDAAGTRDLELGLDNSRKSDTRDDWEQR